MGCTKMSLDPWLLNPWGGDHLPSDLKLNEI
jgi:hypothetical protein